MNQASLTPPGSQPSGDDPFAAFVANANGPSVETVTAVRHWTDQLFSFRITRPASFRFRSGEFVMIGLPVAGKALLRAYSIASPSWDEALDFYSIKVQDGPLTSHLQKIEVGSKILLGRKSTGTLVLDALTPAKRLYLFSTGTGLAPFASVIRDPDTYERFEQVIVTQTCRIAADLAYGDDLVQNAKCDPLVGEAASAKLIHVTSLTREPHALQGRITDLIQSGDFFAHIGAPRFDRAQDRVMICGSMAMLKDTKDLCEAAGLVEGALSAPGDFVVERAFVS
jgi:ferredoxin--NADP+ reductase